MNSRNYDNVPPMVSNTVTIATTAPQVRIVPTGQQQSIRQLSAVPMRQPVPIRKIVHTSAEPPTFSPSYQVKEELDPLDYGASTSSGPLIGPTSGSQSSQNSGNFQQYQRGNGGSPVTSGALIHTNNGLPPPPTNQMDQPAPVNLASKVAEVFLTAGHAFQKLGDLTLQLHTTADAEESKWSEKEVDNLKHALTRFAHELDQISTCVANRTTKHIKNDIKRRHLIASEDAPQQVKRMTMSSAGAGPGPSSSAPANYTTITPMIGHSGQKRTVGVQPMTKLMTTRTLMPTRYTVAPLPASSSTSSSNPTVSLSNSATSSSGQASSSGMPQLQSQGGSAPTTVRPTGATVTRMIHPGTQGVKMSGLVGTKPQRILSTPSSGALVLEQHND